MTPALFNTVVVPVIALTAACLLGIVWTQLRMRSPARARYASLLHEFVAEDLPPDCAAEILAFAERAAPGSELSYHFNRFAVDIDLDQRRVTLVDDSYDDIDKGTTVADLDSLIALIRTDMPKT